ncbi:26S proteasome non-ATPase regulatory subunit 4 isoform 2-T2 [Chlamydotis macqueenii]
MALLQLSGSPGALAEREDSRCSQNRLVLKGSQTFSTPITRHEETRGREEDRLGDARAPLPDRPVSPRPSGAHAAAVTVYIRRLFLIFPPNPYLCFVLVFFFLFYQEGRKHSLNFFFFHDLIFMKLYLSAVLFPFPGDSYSVSREAGGGVYILTSALYWVFRAASFCACACFKVTGDGFYVSLNTPSSFSPARGGDFASPVTSGSSRRRRDPPHRRRVTAWSADGPLLSCLVSPPPPLSRLGPPQEHHPRGADLPPGEQQLAPSVTRCPSGCVTLVASSRCWNHAVSRTRNTRVDNSEYMRNGDFLPTRLQAQQDAVNIVCHSKTRSNPENNVGLITLANNCEVLTTLTPDTGRILSKLHTVQPKGKITFCTGIRVAHLALKHRQGKNHKMRIIAFVGSPVEDNEKDLVKLAKRLKKEKVNVDIINFGEEEANTDKLTAFINTLNGKDGTGSHLVTVPPGPSLADALISSPILAGEGGAMLGLGASDFEFGVDPSADPELALALRVSMEEQRQRQEEEARRAAAASAAEAGIAGTGGDDSDDALLKMTITQQEFGRAGLPDLSSMTEEEQIAYAMQMSLQGAEFAQAEAAEVDSSTAMDTSEPTKEEDDYDVMQDPEFLQSVLENLPGVDPNNEAIRNAMGSLASQASKESKDKKEEEKK